MFKVDIKTINLFIFGINLNIFVYTKKEIIQIVLDARNIFVYSIM